MKAREVIQLLKAGYTKEEINELREQEKEPEAEPGKEDPEEEPEEEPEEPATYHPDEISRLTEQLKSLTELVQGHFRSAAEGSAPDPKAGEQVLKDIIEKGVI